MNRYIKAMELGIANEEKGISYFVLVKLLERELGYKFNGNAEVTFYNWFIENFDYPITSETRTHESESDFFRFLRERSIVDEHELSSKSKYFQEKLSREYFIKGQAAKQYLDYVELKQSKKQAFQASILSIFSIFVAVVAILIGVFQNVRNPKPPYDVKVIENKTRANQLEDENKELKEKLFKAEMLIGIYKSDTTKSN